MKQLLQRRPWIVVKPRADTSSDGVPSSQTTQRKADRNAKARQLLSRLFALAASFLMTLSAAFFQPSTAAQLLPEATAFALSGAVALLVALRLNRGIAGRGDPHRGTSFGRLAGRPYTTSSLSHTASRLTFVHWLAFALGVVYLALLAEISANLFQNPLFANVSHHIQFALFVVGVIFITWGLGGGRFRPHPKPVHAAFLPLSRQWRGGWGVRISILLITLLAFAVRFYEIGDAVHHLVDEIHFSTAVAYFWIAPEFNVPLLAPFGSITAFPWLYPYLQFGAVNIFGRDLEGLRAVSAVMGTLTIPALYLLARTLFDRKTALLAALLLATFPPHMNFSRLGLNNTADPLFGTLALAFLARGLKDGRRMNFAIGGAAFGLTQYFYEGGRFLYLFLICLWLIWVILMGRRDWLESVRTGFTNRWLIRRFLRRHALTDNAAQDTRVSAPPLHRMERGLGGEVKRGIITFLVTAALIAAPVYYTLYAHHKPFSPRMDIVGVGGSYWMRAIASGGGQTAQDHLLTPFLTFVYLPEQALYYGGQHPMILEVFVPLFLLGIAYALWRWRGPGILLLSWIALTCVGNSLMAYSAIYARYVVVFPALALLMALGLRAVVPLILPTWLNARLGAVLMSGAALAIAAIQIGFYFGPHLQFYNQQIRPIPDDEDALFRSVPFPPGTMIHLVTDEKIADSYVYGLLGYLADHLTVAIIHPNELTPEFFASLPRSVDHAFYVEPLDTATPPLLAQHFTLQPPAYSPFNVPREKQYVLYYAASDDGG